AGAVKLQLEQPQAAERAILVCEERVGARKFNKQGAVCRADIVHSRHASVEDGHRPVSARRFARNDYGLRLKGRGGHNIGVKWPVTPRTLAWRELRPCGLRGDLVAPHRRRAVERDEYVVAIIGEREPVRLATDKYRRHDFASDRVDPGD